MADAPATGLMTAEKLLCLPDDGWQYELVQGKLIRMAPSSSRPAIVATRISTRVGVFVAGNALGVVGGADWGFRLTSDPDTVRAPDVAFVRAERLPPPAEREGTLRLVPDLAVEVVSPSDRMTEVREKVREYLEAGVRLVWVVDPRRETVTIFAADGTERVLRAGDTLDGGDVLPDFRLPVADIFR